MRLTQHEPGIFILGFLALSCMLLVFATVYNKAGPSGLGFSIFAVTFTSVLNAPIFIGMWNPKLMSPIPLWFALIGLVVLNLSSIFDLIEGGNSSGLEIPFTIIAILLAVGVIGRVFYHVFLERWTPGKVWLDLKICFPWE